MKKIFEKLVPQSLTIEKNGHKSKFLSMYMNALKYFLPKVDYDLIDNKHIESSTTKLDGTE